MALFDQIMGAIANPDQQGNQDQLSGILNTAQQLAGNYGVDPSVISMVGGYVRGALQQQQAEGSAGQVEAIVNQFGGIGSNPAAVQALFSPEQQAQVGEAISQRTGLSAEQVQGLLTMAVPLVLNMLRTGASNQGAQGGNTVLNAFLDSDSDGDVDIGDAMALAGRFLQSR
ncbi:MAG: DUF937 domain-containing protein [Leptolyngbyaceae cyanobacterium RU_5_1]|nr:DUF937 domain-containing protein [Leptolyngbyaceae cyanobacterium RU_5_1]